MARSRSRFALAILMTMMLAGCVSAPTPEWGTGDGQMQVEIDGDRVEISSKLGTKAYSETLGLMGCEGSELEFTGLLLQSTVYNSHTEDGLESAAGAAIIMHKMTWSEAESVQDGDAGRIGIQDWSSPITPSEGSGNILDIPTQQKAGEWFVFGIIPASENIADGLNVLEIWHQPITITGYIVESGVLGTGDEKCDLAQSSGSGDMMVVTSIVTETGSLSINGDGDDEYELGDTDFFGGGGFILFFMVVGIGGGVGLFILSTMIVRQGAKATAEALLGREGFARAIQMKKDLKRSKKEGLESPSDRAAKMERSAPKTPKRREEKTEELAGFSLDNILANSDDDGGPEEFGGGGNSVVVTNEAASMVSEPSTMAGSSSVVSNVQPIDSSPMASTSVTSSTPERAGKREHFSSAMSGSSIGTQPSKGATPTKAAKPVRRRAVKKRAAEPEPEPEQPAPRRSSSPSIADDDFSDFSL